MSSLTKAQLAQLLATQNTTSNDPVIIEADQFIGDLIGTANVAKRLEKSYRLSINGDAVGSCLLNADDTLLTLQVTHATNASTADAATNANMAARASLADLANLASFALRSKRAVDADRATEATHATSSDTALSAEHATTATNASHATNADSATSAISATNATNAEHAVSADTATTATSALNATNANHAINADHATVADLANVASALNFTIIKVVTAYPQTLDANALYVLVNNDGEIIGIKTKDKTAVDFDIMTVDVLSAISESTDLKDGKLYAVPGEEGTGTKLDPKSASVVFKRKVQGIDVYYQVSGGGGSIVLPEASTTKKGIVQLTNSISTDETKALTPKAVNDLQDTTFVTLSTAQYVYATKDELTNKSLSTAQYVRDNFVTLTTAQYVRALKVFNDVLPQTNLTPSDNKDMTSKIYVDNKVQEAINDADNKFMTLSTAQYVTNLKTFNTVLPQSNLTPSNNNDLSNKKYIDDNLALKANTSLSNLTTSAIYTAQNSTNNFDKQVALHNNIFRGDNLLDYFSDISAIQTAVQSGDFSKIYIGDFIQATITYSNSSYTTKYRVAGINTFLHYGDTELTRNHLVLIPDRLFDAKMNDSNTTSGGYVGSKMYTSVIPALLTSLSGSSSAPFYGKIIAHRELLTSAENAWAWYDNSLCLLSEMEAYGSKIWSSYGNSIGFYAQLPLFRLQSDYISKFNRVTVWLRSIASSSYFCGATGYGYATNGGASNSVGVRPRFLFG